MAAGKAAVQVEGLAQLQRDLRLIGDGLNVELGQAMRKAAQPVLAQARSNTPSRTGALEASLRLRSSGTRVSIVSTRPYANVIHWGGTTGRGHRQGGGRGQGGGSIKIKGSRFAWRAAEQKHQQFVDELARSLDAFFRRHGWA